MVIITTYLMFTSLTSGVHCYDKVFDFSFTLIFSYIMSFFTLSNQLTNFVKSGPVQIISNEKYGGYIILLLCNMATIFFKLVFVFLINIMVNDSIWYEEEIKGSLVTDLDVQTSTIRFVIILLICVLPTAIFVSNQFKL